MDANRESYWRHRLLKGELAAVDSYEHALRDVEDHPSRGTTPWRPVSVRIGRRAWGAFARAVETAASWIDDPTTLKALKEGEVHGVDEYRTALSENHLSPTLEHIVREELLPLQSEHVEELDLLIVRFERPRLDESLPNRIEHARAH